MLTCAATVAVVSLCATGRATQAVNYVMYHAYLHLMGTQRSACSYSCACDTSIFLQISYNRVRGCHEHIALL